MPAGSTYNEWPSPYQWVGLDYNAEDGTSISVKEVSDDHVQVKFSGPLEYWIYDEELYPEGDHWIWVDEDLKNTKISVEGALGTIPNDTRMNAPRHKK